MALSDIVNRVKGLLSGGKSESSSTMDVGGSAGRYDGGDAFANLKEKAGDLADKAKEEATHLADQVQHAASDLQSKAEDLIDRGRDEASSAASDVPDGDAVPDKIEGAANTAHAHATDITSDVTERVDELKTSAEAHVEDAQTEFEERRS